MSTGELRERGTTVAWVPRREVDTTQGGSSQGSLGRGGHKVRTSAWSKAGTLSVEKGLTDSSQRDLVVLLLGTTGVAKEVDTLLRS